MLIYNQQNTMDAFVFWRKQHALVTVCNNTFTYWLNVYNTFKHLRTIFLCLFCLIKLVCFHTNYIVQLELHSHKIRLKENVRGASPCKSCHQNASEVLHFFKCVAMRLLGGCLLPKVLKKSIPISYSCQKLLTKGSVNIFFLADTINYILCFCQSNLEATSVTL